MTPSPPCGDEPCTCSESGRKDLWSLHKDEIFDLSYLKSWMWAVGFQGVRYRLRCFENNVIKSWEEFKGVTWKTGHVYSTQPKESWRGHFVFWAACPRMADWTIYTVFQGAGMAALTFEFFTQFFLNIWIDLGGRDLIEQLFQKIG